MIGLRYWLEFYPLLKYLPFMPRVQEIDLWFSLWLDVVPYWNVWHDFRSEIDLDQFMVEYCFFYLSLRQILSYVCYPLHLVILRGDYYNGTH